MLTGFDRHDVSPLRYWVHAILPLVYDDSLSYYEVLAKISFKMNEVIEGLNANNEQVEKVTQFTIDQVKNLTEAFNNFQASMLERQEQFETKLLDEQHSFETQLKGDIADWEATTEEKFRQQYEDFEQSETEARNAFEKKITDRQDSYEQALTEKENQFETNLTNRFDALESQLQSDLEEWETTTKAELKADIEQWKTDAKQEVLDAIPNVVQETGQSTTDVMSQKASTDTFTHLADMIDLTRIAQGDCDLLPGDGMWHYVTMVSDYEYQNMPPNSGESGAWNTFLYYGSAYTINYDEHDYPAFQLAYVPNSATAAIRVFNDHDGSVKYFESWKLISPILDFNEGVVSDTDKALPASVTIDNFIRFNSEKITVTDFDSVNSRLQYVAISTPFTSALNKPSALAGTENVYYTCIDPGQGTPTQMLFDNTNNRIYYRSMHEGERGAYVWSEWCAVPHVNNLPGINLTSAQDTLSANVLTNNFAYTQDDDTLVQDFNTLGYAPSWQVVSNLAAALNKPSDLRGTESCLYQTVNFENCSVAEKPAIQQLYDTTNSVLYMRMKPNGKAWGQWFKIQDMTAIITALSIGGNNLVEQSDRQFTNITTNYPEYTLTDTLESDSEYTFTVWGELDSSKNTTFFLETASGDPFGDEPQDRPSVIASVRAGVKLERVSDIFPNVYRAVTTGDDVISFKVNTEPLVAGAIKRIDYVKVEKGSTGTPWSPTETEFRNFVKQHSTLVSDVATAKRNITTLQSDVSTLKTDRDTLKTDVDALKQGPSGWDLMYGFAGEYWLKMLMNQTRGTIDPITTNPFTVLKQPPLIGSGAEEAVPNYILYNSRNVRMYSITNDEWITNDNYDSKYATNFAKYPNAEANKVTSFAPFYNNLNTDAGSIFTFDFVTGHIGGIITTPTIMAWQTANILWNLSENEWIVIVPVSNFLKALASTGATYHNYYMKFNNGLIGIPNSSINVPFAADSDTLKKAFASPNKYYDSQNLNKQPGTLTQFGFSFNNYDNTTYAVPLYIKSNNAPIAENSRLTMYTVTGFTEEGEILFD